MLWLVEFDRATSQRRIENAGAGIQVGWLPAARAGIYDDAGRRRMEQSTMSEGKIRTSSAHELIAFRIGEQEFCVDVMSIREIRGWTVATPLPSAPSFVRGVINLRGTVLPILDLAARLGFPISEPTARHAIIVAQVGTQVVGLLVEGVSDIFTVSEDTIQPTPDIASDQSKRFVRGVIPMEGRLISVISLASVLPEGMREAA